MASGFFNIKDYEPINLDGIPDDTTTNKKKKKEQDPCELCGLYKQEGLRSPKMEAFGGGKKGIVVMGEAPGEVEDNNNRPFDPQAPAGGRIHVSLRKAGINLYEDCIVINACDCRPMSKSKLSNREPTNKEILCCYSRKLKLLQKHKPKVVLLLGKSALQSFYGCNEMTKTIITGKRSLGIAALRGKILPDYETGSFICHSYHPSFIERGNTDFEHIFDADIATTMLAYRLASSGSRPTKRPAKISYLIDPSEIRSLLSDIYSNKIPFFFDYETSSFRYYEKIHEIYMVSITKYGYKADTTTYVIPLCGWKTRQENAVFNSILNLWKSILKDPSIKKSAQNIKHETQASHYVYCMETKGWDFDTMIARHVVDDAHGVTNLKNQAFITFGEYNYKREMERYLEAEPKKKNRLPELLGEKFTTFSKEIVDYSGKDSAFGSALVPLLKKQIEKKELWKAYDLLHTGTQAFAEMERNGIKINMRKAKELHKNLGAKLDSLKDSILSSSEAKKFEKVKGRPLTHNKKLSDKDMRELLFGILKFKPFKETKTTFSVDEESLRQFENKCSLINYELQFRRLLKVQSYVNLFLTLQVDGFIYPSFNLHIASSYRSSSDSPNFQNIVKRIKEAPLIRELIIPRHDYIIEVDYKAMEVRIIACFSKDPVLIDYINNDYDPHGDWAERMFLTKRDTIDKDEFKKLRYTAKNGFVFPLFYGSYYKYIATDTYDPELVDISYERWEAHIQRCEEEFWNTFRGVKLWHEKLLAEYKRLGYTRDGAWGFIRQGYLTRNKLFNFPIQGPAYHCLQYTINDLWRNNYYDIESLLCGQIHDALFWDTKGQEVKSLQEKVNYVMREKVREENPWIIVPLDTEWTCGKDWSRMEEI